jgi:hypothetical protein
MHVAAPAVLNSRNGDLIEKAYNCFGNNLTGGLVRQDSAPNNKMALLGGVRPPKKPKNRKKTPSDRIVPIDIQIALHRKSHGR